MTDLFTRGRANSRNSEFKAHNVCAGTLYGYPLPFGQCVGSAPKIGCCHSKTPGHCWPGVAPRCVRAVRYALGGLIVMYPLAMARATSLLCARPVMLGLLRHAAYHWPHVRPVAISAKRRALSPVLGLRAPLITVITLLLSTVVVPGLPWAVLAGVVVVVCLAIFVNPLC